MASNTSLESPFPTVFGRLGQLDGRFGICTIGVISGALALLITLGSQLLPRTDKDGFPFFLGLPIVGSWKFFTKRHDFLHEGIAKLGDAFSFKILQHNVLVVSGEEGRKTFFGHKDLNFTEGYKVLFGASPSMKDVKAGKVDDLEDATKFGKRLTSVIRRDRLAKTLPTMLQDLDRCMEKWGSSGQFDPFDDVYNMVFQLTVRAAACREVADDPELVKRVAKLYWEMEKGATPASVLLPWLPSAAKKRKQQATTELYLLLKDVLDKRIEEGRPEDDPSQYLLDDGDNVNDIVVFIITALFAGIINTGIMTSWITLYLAMNPEWKNKVLNETRSFVAKYAKPDSGANLSTQLAQLPPQVWEEEMNALDVCLRETLRITLTGAALRRVVPTDEGGDVVIKGKKVSPGTFLAFPVTSSHLDPNIYSEPHKWDPSRFDRGEDKKECWSFLGWGVGRHPCLGMRFAKLEVKVIITLFIMQYEYELVDKAGKPVTKLPEPDRTNLYQTPPVEHVYVKYRRIN